MKNLKLILIVLTLMFTFNLSAQKKISQLPELTIPDSTDVLPIVNDGSTKKITVANLLNSATSTPQTLSISNDSLSISDGNTIVLPSSGGGSSLWQTTSGKYEPTETKPLRFSFNNLDLINDSLDLGIAKIPFTGVTSPNISNYMGGVGYVDARNLGSVETYIFGYSNFLTDDYNAILIGDTTYVSIRSNNLIYLESEDLINLESEDLLIKVERMEITANDSIGLILNENGLVLPRISTDPTGISGSVYYNTNTSKFRINEDGTWKDILPDYIPFQDKTDAAYTSAASGTMFVTDGTGTGAVFEVSGIVFKKP